MVFLHAVFVHTSFGNERSFSNRDKKDKDIFLDIETVCEPFLHTIVRGKKVEIDLVCETRRFQN